MVNCLNALFENKINEMQSTNPYGMRNMGSKKYKIQPWDPLSKYFFRFHIGFS